MLDAPASASAPGSLISPARPTIIFTSSNVAVWPGSRNVGASKTGAEPTFAWVSSKPATPASPGQPKIHSRCGSNTSTQAGYEASPANSESKNATASVAAVTRAPSRLGSSETSSFAPASALDATAGEETTEASWRQDISAATAAIHIHRESTKSLIFCTTTIRKTSPRAMAVIGTASS